MRPRPRDDCSGPYAVTVRETRGRRRSLIEDDLDFVPKLRAWDYRQSMFGVASNLERVTGAAIDVVAMSTKTDSEINLVEDEVLNRDEPLREAAVVFH